MPVGSVVRYYAPMILNDLTTTGADEFLFEAADASDSLIISPQETVNVTIEPVAPLALSVSGSSFNRNLTVGLGRTDSSIDNYSDVNLPPDVVTSGMKAHIRAVQGDDSVRMLTDIDELPIGTPPPAGAIVGEWYLRIVTSSGSNSLAWSANGATTLVSQATAATGASAGDLLLFIKNEATGETWNMVNEEFITLNPTSPYDFTISLSMKGDPVTHSYSLVSGWNLISAPGLGDLTSLDAASASAYTYDGGWVPVVTIDNSTLPAVDTGMFVFHTADMPPTIVNASFDVDHPALRNFEVSLFAGTWHLIGAPSDYLGPYALPAAAVTKDLFNKNAVFEYSNGIYGTVSELYPGVGYWVFADTWGTALLTQPRHLSADAASSLFYNYIYITAPSLPSLDWSLPIAMRLNSGVTKKVELGASSMATASYDKFDIGLPPAPPTANYSSIYANTDHAIGRMMRSVQSVRNGTEWTITARMAEAGMLEWPTNAVPENMRLYVETGGRTYDMRENARIRLERGTHQLRVFARMISPTSSRLLANYPNPFNPETWIPF
ncbi:MAG: hypothetical protein O3A46_07430, partial [Candidatus Poribacteria bacterium]|nr:hypothetical protein [Candidatus Poribacteria bacterium]